MINSTIRHISTLDIFPSKEDLKDAKRETSDIVDKLKEQIKKQGIVADVFIGGSFAKGTIVKKDDFDVDIFIRFNWDYENLSQYLEKILSGVFGKKGYEKVHGSRDYFRVKGNRKIIFEIVPVLKIKNPKQARNVTDLSYFHVNYIRKKLKTEKLRNEVVIAKVFCKAQNVYGAENYIKGFSGYGLECLIAYYKSFEKMLKALSKFKEREILDIEKKYKKKTDVLIEMNESRLGSPIVLVDPTWRERNVLAALSQETFKKFQDSARAFLKKPSKEFFIQKKADAEKMQKEAVKRKAEFLRLEIATDRQEGDIAGGKLKKFSDFLIKETAKHFEILNSEFYYEEGKSADLHLILKAKKEIVKIGPPLKLKENVIAFKKANKNVFEKGGFLYSKIKIDYSAKQFIIKFKDSTRQKMKEMGIIDLKIMN